ncbi:37462_t:CDS:2, partial [Gigaspora margarita]
MQTDVQIQLAVTLFCLGTLLTIWAISAQFGITEDFIGAIDGSHIPFFEATSRINKNIYFSKKHQYGIHLQGISASVHNAKVFQHSNIYKQLANFFKKEEYLLGDSAYPLLSF